MRGDGQVVPQQCLKHALTLALTACLVPQIIDVLVTFVYDNETINDVAATILPALLDIAERHEYVAVVVPTGEDDIYLNVSVSGNYEVNVNDGEIAPCFHVALAKGNRVMGWSVGAAIDNEGIRYTIWKCNRIMRSDV